MQRLSKLCLLLLLPLCAVAGEGTAARREAGNFIVETLRKQEGDGWERTGRFLIWDYRFDATGCQLSVQRESGFGDLFQQRIPLTLATAVGTQGNEIVFDCREAAACIDYRIKNLQEVDEQRVARSRLLVMDSADLPPLLNAFVELQQLCRDPYAPARRW
ncbi:MAG: hypothetical protein V4650_07990 [Pseudomonadota bacterium]